MNAGILKSLVFLAIVCGFVAEWPRLYFPVSEVNVYLYIYGTIGCALVLGFLVFGRWASLTLTRFHVGVAAFVLYFITSICFFPVNKAGIYHLSIFLGFVCCIGLAASWSSGLRGKCDETEASNALIAKALGFSISLAMIMSLAHQASYLASFGSFQKMAGTPLAMLIPLSYYLASFFISPKMKTAWVIFFIVLCIGVVMGARTALFACYALIVVVYVSVRIKGRVTSSLRQHLFLGLIIGLPAIGVYLQSARFEDITFYGDEGLYIWGHSINTSGRAMFWQYTWDYAMDSPIVGHGPGSSYELISGQFEGQDHPHNDYLKFLCDFGLVGSLTYLSIFFCYIVRVFPFFLRSQSENLSTAILGSIIAVFAYLIVMITDNPSIYPFIMWPMGAMMGVIIGMIRSPENGNASPHA